MGFPSISVQLNIRRSVDVEWTPSQAARTLVASWFEGTLSITALQGSIGRLGFELGSIGEYWGDARLAADERVDAADVLTTLSAPDDSVLRSAADRLLQPEGDAPATLFVRGALLHRPTFGDRPLGWHGHWVRGERRSRTAQAIALVDVSIELTNLGRSLFWNFPCCGYPLVPVALPRDEQAEVEPSTETSAAAENAERIMPVIARAQSILGLSRDQCRWSVVRDRSWPGAEDLCALWQPRFDSGELLGR